MEDVQSLQFYLAATGMEQCAAALFCRHRGVLGYFGLRGDRYATTFNLVCKKVGLARLRNLVWRYTVLKIYSIHLDTMSQQRFVSRHMILPTDLWNVILSVHCLKVAHFQSQE
jgi:hypothetical protein